MVSAETETFSAEVLRLGGSTPTPIEVSGIGEHVAQAQSTFPGSHIAVPDTSQLRRLAEMTIHAWIYPTRPKAGRRQGLVSKVSARGGWGLYLDAQGRLLFRLEFPNGAAAECSTDNPLSERTWYEVTGSFALSSGMLRLTERQIGSSTSERHTFETTARPPAEHLATDDVPLLIGAGHWHGGRDGHAEEHYDGKIESPSIFGGVLGKETLNRLSAGAPAIKIAPKLLLASWDFSFGISSIDIHETSRNGLHGTAVNMPTRAVTSHSWDADEQCWKHAPDKIRCNSFPY